MKTNLLPAMILCMVSFSVQASIINVPTTVATIQEAINNASSGDTIVVAPGTYYENINYNGKNVFVTSMFYLNSDTSYITSTIINGSMPAHPDTGSCVIFSSYEDSTAVLQGFTITGGTGTKWLDIHGAGTFREGGGILIELSSPIIRFNVITGNYATNNSGVQSAGGGGIRIGDGNPLIYNNVIRFNHGRYGAGVVLNYTGCTIRNNLIVSNTGGEDYFGGSGIWITGNLFGNPKQIYNNTIVNNLAFVPNGAGGVVAWMTSDVDLRNNIIYNNFPALQIRAVSSNPSVDYCNIQGGYPGANNIDIDPQFAAVGYMLLPNSPCIDAGDAAAIYNDREDLSNPGYAMYPSQGTTRNDIGAYGGSGATVHPHMLTAVGVAETEIPDFKIYPNPAINNTMITFPEELRNAVLIVTDVSGKVYVNASGINGISHQLNLESLTSGMYLVRIRTAEMEFATQKFIVQ